MTSSPSIGSSPASSPTASPYQAMQACLASLAGGHADLATVARLLQELSSLGLNALALRLLESLGAGGDTWTAQREAWARQLAACPPGTVPWNSRRRRFLANVAALRRPGMPDLEAFWQAHQDRYELHLATDGNYQLLDLQAPHLLVGLLGGLADHRSQAHAWPAHTPPSVLPVTFEGAGFGWLLLRALERTERTYLSYSAAIHLVEPDLAALCILLHLQDLRPWAGRLHVYAGPEAEDAFEQALEQTPTLSLPTTIITSRLAALPLAARAGQARAIVEAVAGRRAARQAACKDAIAAYYADKTPAFWADRFAEAQGGQRPLTVLGITTRFSTVLQHSMRELGRAISAAGHRFVLAIESDDHSLEHPDLPLVETHKPDLIVQLSRMRYEHPFLPQQVPFLCWDQDNLPCMRTPEATASLDAYTFVAGHGAAVGFVDLDWPATNCILCHAAAANHTYHPGPVDPALLARHRCDFSYVSNTWQPARALRDELRALTSWPEAFDRITGEVLERSEAGEVWEREVLRRFVAGHGLPDERAVNELTDQAQRIADRAFRHVGLRWVADWCGRNGRTLRLYGSGWEKNPEFARFAAGPAARGEELRAIYQASAINLQIIETGFIHARSLDGMAAGGFFLFRQTRNEGLQDGENLQAMHALASAAVARGLLGVAGLEASGDPDLLAKWATLKDWFWSHRPRRPDKAFVTWAANPLPVQTFPELRQIGFSDAASFVETAGRFLSDPAARAAVADAMHRRTLEHFSYDARWRTFLAGISAGLRQAVAQDAPAATKEGR